MFQTFAVFQIYSFIYGNPYCACHKSATRLRVHQRRSVGSCAFWHREGFGDCNNEEEEKEYAELLPGMEMHINKDNLLLFSSSNPASFACSLRLTQYTKSWRRRRVLPELSEEMCPIRPSAENKGNDTVVNFTLILRSNNSGLWVRNKMYIVPLSIVSDDSQISTRVEKSEGRHQQDGNLDRASPVHPHYCSKA